MNTLFAANLKRFRQAKSYTQEQVADKLGETQFRSVRNFADEVNLARRSRI